MSDLVVVSLSIAFAAVPTILYALLIWWLDWYERESPRMVLISFLWGAIVAAGFGAAAEQIVGLPLQILFDPMAADFLLITFAAPFLEELVKGALLLLILHQAEFDNLTDGIVYGAIIGLGFSLSENVAYYYMAYVEGGALAWLGNILFRSAFCCALHATTTAVTGAAIGFAKFGRRRSRVAVIIMGFVAATIIHMGWNGFLSLGEILHAGVLTLVSITALPVVAVIVALLFRWSLNRERTIIRRELAAEAAAGWLPPDHVDRIASIRQRNQPGWFAPAEDQLPYVRTLTELAFRRFQVRFVPRRLRPHYERMIEDLRTLARRLLGAIATGAPPATAPPAPAAAPGPAGPPRPPR